VARTKEAPLAPPRYDAYFGIVLICTIGLLTALIFLYLDYSSFNSAPKALTKTQAGVNFNAQPGNAPPPPAPTPGVGDAQKK
jgi:hypothetical protein